MLQWLSSTPHPLGVLSIDSAKVSSYVQLSYRGLEYCSIDLILHALSADIFTIDEQLMNTLRTYLQTLFNVFSTIVVISGVTPMFTICLIPILIFYVVEQNFFTVRIRFSISRLSITNLARAHLCPFLSPQLTYRELKRLDSVNRSPIYALLGESVDGVAVIRAFSAEESLHRRLTSMLDIQQHAYYLTCAAQSWLAVRLELVGTLIVTFACLSATLEHANAQSNENFAGLAGLAISYALSVTQSLNWSVRMASDMEANMVAVERVQEYTSIETEGSRRTPEDEKLPDSWPTKGDIVFQGAKLRYRQGLPLVLKGLDIHIPAGSKVGVVGRTGAGKVCISLLLYFVLLASTVSHASPPPPACSPTKSTLMVALMRIVELCEGKILIDGQDINGVGLATLRRNIAVIPQDPVLFSGTVRTNLDPFNDFTDEQLYETLARTGLYTGMSIGSSSHSLSSGSQSHVNSLSDTVAEGGNNFSVGQRQLLVIARALLCGAKIVIMDEATAAVDAETDSAIQKVMRTEFADATTITVAHRLNTIMDSDYILVMSDGRAAEFDTPDKLLQTGGLFRDLCLAAQEQSE
jgi:ABC-type multidrug transport system fused ATPase/permease subunit